MQRIFHVDELSAIGALARKAEMMDMRTVKNAMMKRDWVSSPVLEVSGRLPAASWKKTNNEVYKVPHVKIRCLKNPKKNVDILLSPDEENLYTVEVKAILYGIIWAMHNNMRQIQMKNTNEVVVKVANGVYKPTKEKLRFDLIHLFTQTKSTRNGLKMKLEKIDETSNSLKFQADEKLEESELFRKCHDVIKKLKRKLEKQQKENLSKL